MRHAGDTMTPGAGSKQAGKAGGLKGWLLWLAKAALAIALVGWLVSQLNWRDFGAVFEQFQPGWLPAFIGLSIGMLLIRAIKWRMFLKHDGYDVSIARLYAGILIGFLFNNLLPSMVGGDVARGYVIGRSVGSHVHAFASVFMDRFTGVIALMGLAIVVMVIDPRLAYADWRIAGLLAVCLGAGIVGTLLVINGRWLEKTRGALGVVKPLRKPLAKLGQLHEVVRGYGDDKPMLARAMAWSLAFHVATGLNLYLACLCLGLEVTILQAILVTPVLLTVMLLPLTPNGIGLWEWAMMVMLPMVGEASGVSAEAGVAVSLLLRAKGLVLSLLGGVVLVCTRVGAKAPEAEPIGGGLGPAEAVGGGTG